MNFAFTRVREKQNSILRAFPQSLGLFQPKKQLHRAGAVIRILPCLRGGVQTSGDTCTVPTAAATSSAPRDRLFHTALPGSRSGCLRPRLRVEPPCRGGPAEEPGTERRAGPLPHPPRGQQAGEQHPLHTASFPYAVPAHHPSLPSCGCRT